VVKTGGKNGLTVLDGGVGDWVYLEKGKTIIRAHHASLIDKPKVQIAKKTFEKEESAVSSRRHVRTHFDGLKLMNFSSGRLTAHSIRQFLTAGDFFLFPIVEIWLGQTGWSSYL